MVEPAPLEALRDRLCTVPSDGAPEKVLACVAGLLVEAGLPVWRASTAIHALDPSSTGLHLIWARGRDPIAIPRPATLFSHAIYVGTPVQVVIDGAPAVRCRLDVPRAELAYAVLAELADQGGTDYLCLPMDASESLSADTREHHFWRRHWISFATDAPDGFAEHHIATLRALLPVIALRFALEASKQTARTLLRSYLGPNAAQRVLRGAFRRGSADSIRAVVWYCDMRGFTALSDVRPAAEVVQILDGYFDAVASPIDAHGGEVLKFIGDAVLGIFPLADDPAGACGRALAAVTQVQANLARLNEEQRQRGEPVLGLGIALHVGEVSYGNIGAQNRLDFTVIGAPVNEVCRVEAMTRVLGVDVLLTGAFVALAGLADARSLGPQPLKGVAEPLELFTVAGPLVST